MIVLRTVLLDYILIQLDKDLRGPSYVCIEGFKEAYSSKIELAYWFQIGLHMYV